jgi:hypothetical protein
MRTLFLLLLLTSCLKKDGVSTGRLLVAEEEGLFFKSCEVSIQSGDGSSRILEYSSRDLKLCRSLMKNTGKFIKLRYHYEVIAITVNTHYLIDQVVLENKQE